MREPVELSYERCRELLSSVEVGRVALCVDTGPLIWPVNYSVVEDAIVYRTVPYSVLGMRVWNSRLAFEVDRPTRPRTAAGVERGRDRFR